MNVNKISFPLVQHGQLLLRRLAVNLPDGLRGEAEPGREMSLSTLIAWRDFGMSCTLFKWNTKYVLSLSFDPAFRSQTPELKI